MPGLKHTIKRDKRSFNVTPVALVFFVLQIGFLVGLQASVWMRMHVPNYSPKTSNIRNGEEDPSVPTLVKLTSLVEAARTIDVEVAKEPSGNVNHIPRGRVRKNLTVKIKPFTRERPKMKYFPLYTRFYGKHRPAQGMLTIGIPTAAQGKVGLNHLNLTLESIFSTLHTHEKEDVIIMIYITDENEKYQAEVIQHIRKAYPAEVMSGIIQVFLADMRDYPKLENLVRNDGVPIGTVRRRTKQVIDYAFMFYHAQNLSKYYIQLEDDVVCAPDFYDKIMTFMKGVTGKWVTLEFSESGFIGKLFRSSELLSLSQYMLMFFDDSPADKLYMKYPILKGASGNIPMRKPGLFQQRRNISPFKSKRANKTKGHFVRISESRSARRMGHVQKLPATMHKHNASNS